MRATAARDRVVRDVEERVTGDGFIADVLVSALNARVEVQTYSADNPAAMASALEKRAAKAGVDKVFVKARESHREALEDAGMSTEAEIEGYFDGRPAVVLSRFLSEKRRRQSAVQEQEERKNSPGLDPSTRGTGVPEELPEWLNQSTSS